MSSSECDGCGKATEKTTLREVDDSLFELCVACDPYSDVSLAATAESVADKLSEDQARAKEIAFEDEGEEDGMADYFEGRADGLDTAVREFQRVTGGGSA